jgi:hypothetical protein
MSKAKLPGRIWIDREMIESRAYISLTGFAPQLLTLVLGKRQFGKQGRKGKEKWVLVNGDNINITYTEFKRKYGVTQPRHTRAIDQLLARVFYQWFTLGGCIGTTRPSMPYLTTGGYGDRERYLRLEKWYLRLEKRKVLHVGFVSQKNKTRIRNRNHTHQRKRNHKP